MQEQGPYRCLYGHHCLKYHLVPCEEAVLCPILDECALWDRIYRFVEKKYKKCSYIRGLKGWSHGNVSKVVLYRMFLDSIDTGFRCAYCGQEMTLDIQKPHSVSLEHIRARALGGGNEPENLCLVCYSCNIAKGDKERMMVEMNRMWKK